MGWLPFTPEWLGEQIETDQKTATMGLDELDELFHVLRSRRRRAAMAVIDERAPIDISDLTEELVVMECGQDFDSTDRKRVYVSLYQTHMPELVKHEVVKEPERSVYEEGPNLELYVNAFGCVAETVEEFQ